MAVYCAISENENCLIRNGEIQSGSKDNFAVRFIIYLVTSKSEMKEMG